MERNHSPGEELVLLLNDDNDILNFLYCQMHQIIRHTDFIDNKFYEKNLLYVQTLRHAVFMEYFVGKEVRLIAGNMANLKVKMKSDI
jgi:hypothetical protein